MLLQENTLAVLAGEKNALDSVMIDDSSSNSTDSKNGVEVPNDKDLSVEEQAELDQLVSGIRQKLNSAFDAGRELMTIRDRKLFRGKWQSFGDFCQATFG